MIKEISHYAFDIQEIIIVEAKKQSGDHKVEV